MLREPCVYVLAKSSHSTFYTGCTSNLVQRIHQHRSEYFGGFTAEYGIKRLVCSTLDRFGIIKRIVDAKMQFRLLAYKLSSKPFMRDASRHWRLDFLDVPRRYLIRATVALFA